MLPDLTLKETQERVTSCAYIRGLPIDFCTLSDLRRLTGGHYDIITFDPRGTGDTLPYSCYNTSLESTTATSSIPIPWDQSDTSLGTAWATLQMLAEQCLITTSETAELLGTAFVARDIVNVYDALGEGNKIHYYGMPLTSGDESSLTSCPQDCLTEQLLAPLWQQCFQTA